jgi:TP901 family phage tail tape measure protein
VSEPGAFEVGSAYVQVDPNAEGFAEALEEQIAGIDLVVQIPVVPDASGLQAGVDAAVADSKASVVVPVTADPAGLQESIDAATKDSGATVVVPMEADPGDLATQADAAADAAADSAGSTFGEKFSSVAGQMSLFAPDEGAMEAGGTAGGDAAGQGFGAAFSGAAAAASDGLAPELASEWRVAGTEAGASLGEAFSASVSAAVAASSAAWGEIPVAAEDAARAAVLNTTQAWGAIIPPAATAGTEAGEAAGEGFVSRLAAMLSGVTSMFTGLIPGAAAEGAEAGEAAGEGFASRFAAMMSGVGGSFTGMFAGMDAEAGAAGGEAGESYAAGLKGAITGDISPMEALLGAAFVAAAADMASKFQAAMELVHTQAGVAQSAISGLSGSVLTLAGQVGLSPDSLAETLYHVESAFQSTGITGQKAMDLVKVAAEGARTGGANVVDVVNALDGAMVSGIGGISNYQQAMGALNAIVGSGDMKMQDLADAMGTGIVAVAKSYGQNIYQVGAALATFGDNNIRGAKAATDLRMAMQAILQPVSTAGDALHQLGLTSTQLGNTMTHQGLTAALAQFVDHLKASKVPMDDWGNYITEIFGKKAGAGINVLIDQLSRMQGKLPDIEKGAHDFGSAWAATQQTTSQKLKELESSFETLMIKIGSGLLPAVDAFMSMVTRNLPGLEAFGSHIAHMVSPVVTGFFRELEAVLKELLGPLRGVTEVAGITLIAFMGFVKLVGVFEAVGKAWKALQILLLDNPWVLVATAVVALAVVIVKYHAQIWDVIKSTWGKVEAFFKKFWPELLAGALLFFGPVIAGMIALAALIIKYHADILAAVEKTWDAISKAVSKAFDTIVKGVEKTFDDMKKEITTGFDAWWKSHGAELEQVWNEVWKAISTFFTDTWDQITEAVQVAWALVGPFIETSLAELETAWKITWAAITAVFTTAWDVIAAAVKVATAAIEAVIKIAWDVVVGLFDVALDLITGHWSKAWTDLQATATQVWNAIKQFLTTTWDAIASLVTQVVNSIKTFLSSAWDDIKGDATTAFNAVRHGIASIWDGILSDIEGVISKIKSAISSVTSLPGKVASSVLGAVGLAGGGVLSGYAPGRDTAGPFMLSPGEGVLVPEAVRAIGPANINAINAHFSAGRSHGGGGGYAGGGVVPDPYAGAVRHFADGGMVGGGLSAYQAGAAAGQQYSAMESTGHGGDGATVVQNLYFTGTTFPTPEQQQAMMSRLALLAGAM